MVFIDFFCITIAFESLFNCKCYSKFLFFYFHISDILGAEEDEEDLDDEDGEYEEEDDTDLQKGHGLSHSHIKHKLKKKLRNKKYSKYMMPLLLAYKLKYFALIPVMLGGLVLLVGATGLAGFFFALFAAVMGLQKGGY